MTYSVCQIAAAICTARCRARQARSWGHAKPRLHVRNLRNPKRGVREYGIELQYLRLYRAQWPRDALCPRNGPDYSLDSLQTSKCLELVYIGLDPCTRCNHWGTRTPQARREFSIASMAHSLYLFLPAVAIAVVVFKLSQVGRRPAGYPPGPPTLPLIGNIHQVRLAPQAFWHTSES